MPGKRERMKIEIECWQLNIARRRMAAKGMMGGHPQENAMPMQ